MKRLTLLLLCWCLCVGVACARTLSKTESDRLREEVAAVMSAFDRGNPEPLIRRTHPAMQQLLSGGSAAFATATRQYTDGLKQSGLQVLSAEVGTPSEVHVAGNEEVCFVPRITVLDLKGDKARSQSFVVAIRRIGDHAWYYLDGANLRKHPEMLYQVLPQLNPFVPVPPNSIEAAK